MDEPHCPVRRPGKRAGARPARRYRDPRDARPVRFRGTPAFRLYPRRQGRRVTWSAAMAAMPVLVIGLDSGWRARMQRLLAWRRELDWLGAYAPAQPRPG